MPYTTVAKATEHLEIVKGSRFIAWVTPLEPEEDIEVHIEAIRLRYDDASHHCFAYKQGQTMRFSDDGEPGGTAGRPMLEVIQKRNLDHSLAVVTRYFGGTKLGAGGLVRAYSGSVAKALDQAGTFEVKDRVKLQFELPFARMDSVHRLLNSINALSKDHTNYSDQGLILTISLFEEDQDDLKKALISVTRGELKWLNNT